MASGEPARHAANHPVISPSADDEAGVLDAGSSVTGWAGRSHERSGWVYYAEKVGPNSSADRDECQG